MHTETLNRLALALDNIDKREIIESLINATVPWIGVYKIGLEQFVRFGPPVLDLVRKVNRKIFLDLKLHDIPNTVARAVSSACSLGVDYLTIHTQGGMEMIGKAVEAAKEYGAGSRPAIIAVTLLTSIDAGMLKNELHVQMELTEYVRSLAKQAIGAGADGIVCSAADLSFVKPILPRQCIIITPGVRPAGADAHDQKRTSTPSGAVMAGATLLVLGRTVTAAEDPAYAARSVYEEIETLMQK